VLDEEAPKRSSRRFAVIHAAGPTLTVWIYDSAMGAAAGEVRLRDLKSRNALEVHDAVTVSWLPGAHLPRIGHLWRETSAAAARGSVLGGLVDLIFLAPGADSVSGPGVVALAQRLRDTGVDQAFLEEIEAQLRPGTSALVVLSGDADLDEVRPVIERGLARGDVVLMHALLSDDAPELLREAVRELQSQRPRQVAAAAYRAAQNA
jgi:uncharacterized membrane protein